MKEVVKAVRKTPASVLKAGSLCVIAGNISPIDVIAHLPVLCEDNGVPYCFVRSKEVRGAAARRARRAGVRRAPAGATRARSC